MLYLPLSTLLFLDDDIPAVQTKNAMLRECMLKFLGDDKEKHLLPADVCKWIGVHCNTRSQVTKINMKNTRLRSNPRMEFLPSTVEHLMLFNQNIDSEIDTRMLPAELRHANIAEASLHGSINMQTLPVKLIILRLQRNFLSGAILLGLLPPKLQVLNLADNPFSRVYVSNRSLPKFLTEVTFRSPKKGKKIPILSVDGDDADYRIMNT